MDFSGKITDVRITKGVSAYRLIWWQKLLQKIGLWIARLGGYKEATVPWPSFDGEKSALPDEPI